MIEKEMNMNYEDFIDLAQRNITSHDKFMWNCYGDTAYTMDSWDGEQDGRSISMIYDLSGLHVYQMTVYDYKKKRAYRYFNTEYSKAFFDEVKERGVTDNAWSEDDGDVSYTDLESYDDFLEKATAIMNYEDYDTRISIPITLPDDELLMIFKLAHEADMTFNDFVEKILRDKMADIEYEKYLKTLANKNLKDIHGTI
jgi:hypothetical protein